MQSLRHNVGVFPLPRGGLGLFVLLSHCIILDKIAPQNFQAAGTPKTQESSLLMSAELRHSPWEINREGLQDWTDGGRFGRLFSKSLASNAKTGFIYAVGPVQNTE